MIPYVNLQVQGDLIYLMDVCGTKDHIAKLKQLASVIVDKDDIHQDAIEEAVEAIKTITLRCNLIIEKLNSIVKNTFFFKHLKLFFCTDEGYKQ